MNEVYNKKKIAIMAKMAVYDKNGFEKDAKSNQYFRHDFIYKKNMSMRFFVGVGCLFLAGFYVLHLFAFREADIFTIDYFSMFARLIVAALVIMVAYSFIGMIVYTREYEISRRRIRRYFALMDELEGGEKKRTAPAVKAKMQEIEEVDEEKGAIEDDEPDVYRPKARPIPYRIRTTDEKK